MKTIFVSSTFKDMQYERDAIQNIVAPRVNEVARQYGDSVSFCDLRWGIDTSELENDQSAQKVLNVCLDEIDRCQNPMVVILGDRYGWIPEEEQVARIAGAKNLSLADMMKSVTALEIEYGAFRNESRLQNTLFYMRHVDTPFIPGCEPEDAEHDRLQKELKQKVEALSMNGIREYSLHSEEALAEDIRVFAEMLAEDIIASLKPEWESLQSLTAIQHENRTHFAYFQEKAQLFRARRYLLPKYRSLLEENTLTVLKGAPGSGKSTLVAALVQELRNEDKNVIACECALTSGTSTSQGVLSYLIDSMEKMEDDLEGIIFLDDEDEFIEKEYHFKAPSFAEYRMELNRLCGLLPDLCVDTEEEKHIYIVIDGCDQLMEDEFRNKLQFLPGKLNPYIHILVSCIEQMPVQAVNIQKFPGMTDEAEKEEMVASILQNHRRELQGNVVREILKKKGSDNPLYLSMLVQRLLMMNRKDFAAISALGDGMAAISAYQINLLKDAAEEVQKMGVEILDVAAEQIGAGVMREVVELLGVSEKGLRVEDLQRLVPGFNRLDFANFISLMQENFIRRADGRFDFSHASIRNGVRAVYAQDTKACDKLYLYFAGLDDTDALKHSQMFYHCIYGSHRADLKDFIASYKAENGTELPEALVRFCALHSEAEIADVLDCCGGNENIWQFYNTHLIPAFGEDGSELKGREKLLCALEQKVGSAYNELSEEMKRQYIAFALLTGDHFYNKTEYETAKEKYQKAIDVLEACGLPLYAVNEYIAVLALAYKKQAQAIAGRRILSAEDTRLGKDRLNDADVLALKLYTDDNSEENTLRLCDLWMLNGELYQAAHFAVTDFRTYAKDAARNEAGRKDSATFLGKALELLANLPQNNDNLMRECQCENMLGCIKEYTENEGVEKAAAHFERAWQYLEKMESNTLAVLRKRAEITDNMIRVAIEQHPDVSEERTEKLFDRFIEYQKSIAAIVQEEEEFKRVLNAYHDKAEYYRMLLQKTPEDMKKADAEDRKAAEFDSYVQEILGLSDGWYTASAEESAVSDEQAYAFGEVWEMLCRMGSETMSRIPLYQRKQYYRYSCQKDIVLQDDSVEHMTPAAQEIFGELEKVFFADIQERKRLMAEIQKQEFMENTPWFLKGLPEEDVQSYRDSLTNPKPGVKKKRIIVRTIQDPMKVEQWSVTSGVPMGAEIVFVKDPAIKIQCLYAHYVLWNGVKRISDVARELIEIDDSEDIFADFKAIYANFTYDDGVSGPRTLNDIISGKVDKINQMAENGQLGEDN